MAKKLTSTEIDNLKCKGFITSVDPSAALASQTIDELKEKIYITVTDDSAALEYGAEYGF